MHLIYNMYSMRISGNEPSSVFQKLKRLPESAKTKLKPKGMV